MSATSTIDPARLASLIEAEEATFNERHKHSREMTERARRSLAGGVASSWQDTEPHPIYLAEGHGSKVVDVDGNEYVDFHNGYGAMAVGHAHPRIAEVVSERVRLGTHFAQPTEDSIAVAEHLQQRFGLPLWRFGNSGTESTLDAVRLARAYTGRDILFKIEGSYHGHHDALMVSVAPPADKIGRLRRSRVGAPDAGPAGRLREADQGGAVQRPGGARAHAQPLQGPGGRHDRGAGDDERRVRAARGGLPAGGQGPAARARRAAGVRRGQDRCHALLRRRRRGLRRHARPAVPGQVGRRRAALRGDRRHRRGDGLDRATARSTRSARSTATR